MSDGEPSPYAHVSAEAHTVLSGRSHARDAASLVTVYLVLLFAIPSNVTIGSLGSLGRPAMLWGVATFLFWLLFRLQRRGVTLAPTAQPVRAALVVFVVVVLVSFAAAMLRGQPTDQVSPALTSIVNLVASSGVLLIILDGVQTMRDVTRIARRVGYCLAILALLALLQNITHEYLLDFWHSVPGFTVGDGGGLSERSGLIRAAATATHPLELVTALGVGLSLCIAGALTHGFRRDGSRARALLWWAMAAIVAIVMLTGVSRTAIIGFIVAVLAMLPAVPTRYRTQVIVGGLAIGAALVVAVPGLAGATMSLFTGAAQDGSTLSRTDALARLTEFTAPSPIVGIGLGTFLPRYYIFDNQWAVTAIELGLIGVVAFAALPFTGIWSAWNARTTSTQSDVRLLSHALAAATLNVSVLFAFFDGMSFPISAGLLFVLLGLCGAMRTVSAAEHATIDLPRPSSQWPARLTMVTDPVTQHGLARRLREVDE